ncbi:MAG: SNF2-related protein [Nanoarchaeota archaeon]
MSNISTNKYKNIKESIKKFNKLVYNFEHIENKLYFFCSINNERLNCIEIQSILQLNENENFLSKDDHTMLNYIIHKLSQTQAYYQVLNDFDFFFAHLTNSSFKILYNKKHVQFLNKNYKLKIELKIDKHGEIQFILHDDKNFIFGLDKAFIYKKNENKIYKLSNLLDSNFYQNLLLKSYNISIDFFFEFEKKYLNTLEKEHNTIISQDIKNLQQLNIKEKVAKNILEVDKTNHFIVVELKYKIGNKTYKIDDYKYLDTKDWLDKTSLIKIIKENNELIKYVSNEELSEDIFEDIFKNSLITYRRYIKGPFKIVLPIFQLNNFVNKVLPNAQKLLEINYKHGQELKLKNDKASFILDTNLDKKLNLLEFTLKFKIGDEYFDLEFVKQLMLKSRKYVQLKNGTTINVENIREINKWIEFLKMFSFSINTKKFKAPSQSALELDKFIENISNTQIKYNSEYKTFIEELRGKKPVEKVDIPLKIKKILRDYQKEGIYWIQFLKKYGFGGILADEMGLGKTLQALTALSMEEKGTSIIICPKTLIYNWENEINKFFPEKSKIIIDGDNEKRTKNIKVSDKYDFVITSYSLLQKDYKSYIDKNLTFNYLVLDEAHYVKNIKTLSAKAVRLIKSNNTLLLTGTPLENNLTELYSTFDLIMPGFLGTKYDFNKDFVAKVERNNMIALEILQSKIKPFILRRTKNEVLKELPAKQEKIVYSEMTNKQSVIYNELLNRAKDEINNLVKTQGFDKSRIQILSTLLKLRQICNHPALIDKSFAKEENISGKFEQFMELLMQVINNGEKVLVFSQFTSMLDIFQTELENSNITYSRLDGSSKDRQQIVEEFNKNKSIKVFLISLKAGGHGLNLTSASSVFLYDPWWNPMIEQQAKDRAHRIGQRNNVSVYKFITKNSIEEKILKLQERKDHLFDNLIKENTGFMKKLEWEDLMELFE